MPFTEKLLVILRDGRKLIGILRSFDQFGITSSILTPVIVSVVISEVFTGNFSVFPFYLQFSLQSKEKACIWILLEKLKWITNLLARKKIAFMFLLENELNVWCFCIVAYNLFWKRDGICLQLTVIVVKCLNVRLRDALFFLPFESKVLWVHTEMANARRRLMQSRGLDILNSGSIADNIWSRDGIFDGEVLIFVS